MVVVIRHNYASVPNGSSQGVKLSWNDSLFISFSRYQLVVPVTY